MSKKILRIRKDIRRNGYVSATKIILDATIQYPNMSKKEIYNLLEQIECRDICKIQYTNSYISDTLFKYLYCYKPKKKAKSKKYMIFVPWVLIYSES